jgi:hypothetical protein
MTHQKNLDAGFVFRYLEKMEKRPPDRQLLTKGKDAYNLIKTTLLNHTNTEIRKWH